MHWPRGGWGNTDTHGSGRGTKFQGEYPHIRDPLFRGGGPDDRRTNSLVRDPLSKEFQEQGAATKSGMTGLAHQHPMGGITPGGGGGTPPPGRGGPSR